MRNNPYSLSFGKKPENYIDRNFQQNEILDTFLSDKPSSHVYMITGVRGSGKTVMLTTISNVLGNEPDWYVVDLSPERDILQSLAAELNSIPQLMQTFRDAKINLSLFGLGVEIDGMPPITDITVALHKMLSRITSKGKKVLITIDEVTSNRYIREFVSQFQIFLRKDFSVYLLMTGLFENIYELQNVDSLTFLYRAPKIALTPLNTSMIARQYESVFDLTQEAALTMAKVTKGYPFAFQVLGYLCYKQQTTWDNIVPEFDCYLEEYVYEKIWSELSDLDQRAMKAICDSESSKVEHIRAAINMDSNKFNIYRNRLIRKGLVVSESYGHLSFALPRFEEFIQRLTGSRG